MLNLNLYSEVKNWKKPVHVSRAFLAKSYIKILNNLDVIGITGSVGKTVTQNAIVSILSQKYNTINPDENLDPPFRIPQTILSARPWHQKLVLEFGVEHPGEINSYLSLIRPKIAVVTVISPTHLKYFESIEGVFKEKSKLIEALPKNGNAVLNADDPNVAKMAQLTKAKIWWYGQKAKNGVKISHYTQNLKGSKFRLHYQGQKATVSWKVIGQHQLTSAYAAATVGIISGLTIKQIAKGLSQTKPPIHRLNLIVTKNINIIDDTYNSSPKAAEEAVKTLIALGKGKQKIAVLGEMKDLGKDSEQAHNNLGKIIAKSNLSFLITVGKTASRITKSAKANGFRGKTIETSTTKEAEKETKKMLTKKSLVLVKGSRHAHLERIVYGLLHKPTTVNCYHCGTLN